MRSPSAGRDRCSDLIGRIGFTDCVWCLATGSYADRHAPPLHRRRDGADCEHGPVPSVQAASDGPCPRTRADAGRRRRQTARHWVRGDLAITYDGPAPALTGGRAASPPLPRAGARPKSMKELRPARSGRLRGILHPRSFSICRPQGGCHRRKPRHRPRPCRGLAEAGADLAVTARREARWRRPPLPSRRSGAGRAARPRCPRPEDCGERDSLAEADLGGLDILVNNAGHEEVRPSLDVDEHALGAHRSTPT